MAGDAERAGAGDVAHLGPGLRERSPAGPAATAGAPLDITAGLLQSFQVGDARIDNFAVVVADFFAMLAKVITFVGQWLVLPPSNQCRLGESAGTGTLGTTAIVGSRFWETQLKFRLRLGPMRLEDLYRMLPIGDAFRRLKCWVLNYSGQEYFWDVQLVLKAEEVPETRLGEAGLLGWTTWLKSKPFTHDADDLVVNGG